MRLKAITTTIISILVSISYSIYVETGSVNIPVKFWSGILSGPFYVFTIIVAVPLLYSFLTYLISGKFGLKTFTNMMVASLILVGILLILSIGYYGL